MIYYDTKCKRYRDEKGRFVSKITALNYLLNHQTIQAKSIKTGKLYRSSVRRATELLGNLIRDLWKVKKDIRTDTLSVDVTFAFEFDDRLWCKDIGFIGRLVSGIRQAYYQRYKHRRYYLYFQGIVYSKTGVIQQVVIGSKQLTERHENWFFVRAMVEEFTEKVSQDVHRFRKSEIKVTMEKVVFVFKGWNYGGAGNEKHTAKERGKE